MKDKPCSSISIKRIVCLSLSLSLSLSVCLSRCIRTVFKIRSSNFSDRSRTYRSRSWRGWRFYGTPSGSEIKGKSLKKRKFYMHSHSFQDTELILHRYVNDSPGQVVEGLTILRNPVGLRNKGLITQKNVNSTCIRTELKLHRYVTDSSSMTLRDRSWRGWWFYGNPWGSEIKG